MNKDFDLKKESFYSNAPLRSRIDETIKRVRDESDEMNQPQAKSMPIIPVTGAGKQHKYLDNKTTEKF